MGWPARPGSALVVDARASAADARDGSDEHLLPARSFQLGRRAARRLEPKREQPIPDELALPWLNTELARAWLPEDAGLSVRAVEQPAECDRR